MIIIILLRDFKNYFIIGKTVKGVNMFLFEPQLTSIKITFYNQFVLIFIFLYSSCTKEYEFKKYEYFC